MKVREWKPQDLPKISQLYYNTVLHINSRDYSSEHIKVWASEQQEDFWSKRFDNYTVRVVEQGKQVLGFAEYQYPGHIDCFYVHHEWQGKGVGSLLLTEIEALARQESSKRLFADVSITARPFFLAKNFHVVNQQNKVYKNLSFKQYFMEKWL